MTLGITIINDIDYGKLSCLSEYELTKFWSLSEQARRDFLAGRIALKTAFLKYGNSNIKYSDIIIENLENGQPNIKGHKDIYCSISHSYGWGIGAIAVNRIGVDIEKIRPHKKVLLKYIAEPQDIRTTKKFFDRNIGIDEITTFIWVIKEATMKGLGKGFCISPQKIKINQIMDAKCFQVIVEDKESQLWYVWPFKKDKFYIAIAYENDYQQIPFINWNRWNCI